MTVKKSQRLTGSCQNFFTFFVSIFIFRSALSRLGIESRTCGYWAHDLMNFFAETVPTSLLLNIVYNQMRTIKAKEKETKLRILKKKSVFQSHITTKKICQKKSTDFLFDSDSIAFYFCHFSKLESALFYEINLNV